MRSFRKHCMRLVPLVGLLLMVATGCGGTTAPFAKTEQATPTPVPTPIVPEKPRYVVERGTVRHTLEFLGRVSPVREEELYFQMNGFIRSVAVEKDDPVTEGQILAELEIQDLLNQLKQSEIALETAQVRLEEAQKDHDYDLAQAQKRLELAQLKLEEVMSPAAIDNAGIVTAKANMEIAQVDVQQAQAAYDRSAWRHGFETSPEAAALHEATLRFEIAQANYNKLLAQAAQEAEGQNRDIAVQQKELELAQLELQQVQEGVDPLLQKEVERAELTVQRLQAQADSARIIAPFDGIATAVSAYAGRQATAYNPLIVVADLEELEINAEVASRIMEDMQEGIEASVVFSNIPGVALRGIVEQMPYPFGSGGGVTLEEQDKATHISLDPAQLQGLNMETGMLAKVTIVAEQKDDVLRLPKEAIRLFSGRRFVVIETADGVEQRADVKLGLEGDDYVEIEEGVTEGQVIVGQ